MSLNYRESSRILKEWGYSRAKGQELAADHRRGFKSRWAARILGKHERPHIWISCLHQFHPLPGIFVGDDQPEKALPPPHSPTSSEDVWVPLPPATSSCPTPRLPVGIQPWARV